MGSDGAAYASDVFDVVGAVREPHRLHDVCFRSLRIPQHPLPHPEQEVVTRVAQPTLPSLPDNKPLSSVATPLSMITNPIIPSETHSPF